MLPAYIDFYFFKSNELISSIQFYQHMENIREQLCTFHGNLIE